MQVYEHADVCTVHPHVSKPILYFLPIVYNLFAHWTFFVYVYSVKSIKYKKNKIHIKHINVFTCTNNLTHDRILIFCSVTN